MPVDMKDSCCYCPVVNPLRLLVNCRAEVEVAAPQLLLPRAREKCVRSLKGDHFSPNPASLQKLRITSVLNRSCQTTSNADLVVSSSSSAVWFQYAPGYLVFCSVLLDALVAYATGYTSIRCEHWCRDKTRYIPGSQQSLFRVSHKPRVSKHNPNIKSKYSSHDG